MTCGSGPRKRGPRTTTISPPPRRNRGGLKGVTNMKSRIHFLGLLLLFTTTASAHFIFVVPEPGAEKAKVILSETLEADEDVDVKLIAKTDLAVRGADGDETKVLLGENSAGHAFSIPLPG